MQNIIQRANTWYFSRRVPILLRQYDPREYVRFSLKTDSKKIAARLAEKENSRLDQYWANLIETGEKHAHGKYKQLVERAQLLGFVYQHVDALATGDYPELIKRLLHVEKHSYQEVHVEAVLGTQTEPQITLAEVFPIYVALNRSVEVEKSSREYRKWKNPRKLAMANLISCLGWVYR